MDGKENVFLTHDVIDTLERQLWAELGIRATVHMDPIVTDDERVNQLRQKVLDVVHGVDDRLRIHDFRFVEGHTHSNLIFDIEVPFEITDSDEELRRLVSTAISEWDSHYFTVITVDRQ